MDINANKIGSSHHVEVELVEPTQEEEEVATQLVEDHLVADVLCEPFDHVILGEEVLPAE